MEVIEVKKIARSFTITEWKQDDFHLLYTILSKYFEFTPITILEIEYHEHS